MRRFTLLNIILSSLLLPLNAAAEEMQQNLESLPEVPEPPKQTQSGENLEPDITIVRREKKTIQEFRRGGRLYMIKVVPDAGAPYYFLDTDGDGRMDVRSSELDDGSRINMWKLLEWR